MKAPFITAEVSANHLGDKGRALAIIDAAADSGADGVKLQSWFPGSMCLNGHVIARGAWAGQKLADLYAKAHLPWEWHEELFEHAHSRGLVCFASVFDLRALAFLESLGCPIYKIASFELVDIPLIRAVAATGKPMMLSTGMATFDEIAGAWGAAMGAGCQDICLLKCTSAYPAQPEDANLATMQNLERAFGGQKTTVGLSDHSLGHDVAMAATVLGASVIEKHLTLSRADGGPDAGFSMEPAEFASLVKACRSAAKMRGEVRYGCGQNESTELRRSIYLAKPIKRGEVLTEAHLTTARPALGLPPRVLTDIIGARVTQDAEAGTPVTKEMLCA